MTSVARTARVVGGLLGLLLAWCSALWLDHRLTCASMLLRLEHAEKPSWLVRYRERVVKTREFAFAGGRGRLYWPQDHPHGRGIVVAHGMHEGGIEEPRMVSLAQALANAGFVVLTPEVVGLAHYRIEHADVERISKAASALAEQTQQSQVIVFGISFGGGLAIRAACEPTWRGPISRVIALGAHHDALRVSRFYLGQPALGPRGERAQIEPHPYGRVALWQSLHGELHKGDFSEAERLSVLSELEARKAELERASPRTCPTPPRVPLFLLHGSADRVVPYTETSWNREQFAGATLISPAIVHAEYAPVSLADRARLVDFMAKALY